MKRPDGAGGGRIDYWLLIVVLLLAGFGLVMVYSASGIMAEKFYHNKYHFFIRQGIFFLVGLAGMGFCALVPRRFFYDLNYLWLTGAVVLLLATLYSPLSVQANGARRWLALGPVSIQPLELAKIALVFYLAYFYSTKQALVKSFSVGFLPPFIVTGVVCLVLLLQPDYGGAVTLALILFFMSLVGGARIIYLVMAAFFGAGGGMLLIIHSPYRLKRWLAFLDPFKEAKTVGYQLVQSLYAFGSGKIMGVGLGAGKQKLFFLPEAHNDFIMAVVGEEMGFVGVSLVFLCLGCVLWRAFKIAMAQDSMQDRFVAYGMALILGLGMLLNLAVVMGTVPPKGVPMPFMSYGGSNLVAAFICIGVLLNLSRGVSGGETRGGGRAPVGGAA